MTMIGVLTHHWAKDDQIEAARNLLDRNGDAQSRAPGFVSRETFYSLTDPAKITTMVKWTATKSTKNGAPAPSAPPSCQAPMSSGPSTPNPSASTSSTSFSATFIRHSRESGNPVGRG